MDSTFKERLKYFEVTLSRQDEDQEYSEIWTPLIDMKVFREACFKGIPEESGLRATAWKVLMGSLPADKRLWDSTIYKQRLSYYNLVRELLEPPSEEPPAKDHPSNYTPGSKWATYDQDNNTLEQIDKDVRRTLPDFAFFQQKVPQNPLNPLSAPPAPLPPNPIPLNYNTEETGFDVNPLRQNDTKRRFSFSIMGRPRSGSNTSKKSLKINLNNNSSNNINTNNENINTNLTTITNRSRSNSRSSVRSFSSGMMENGAEMIHSHSPRNIVRKLSTAFSKSSTSLTIPSSKQKRHTPSVTLKPICPYIPNRRSLFQRIQRHDQTDAQEEDDGYIQDYHWEVIERILFIYAKLNPGIGYVQGMNELLAPIYYVFANDTSPGLAGQVHAEADTFAVFTTLMGDVRDHFVRSLDQDAGTGIHGTMFRLQQRLAWYDGYLWRELQRKNVKEPYYAFRWITVLFTQEWNLPDVIRLWDSLLAERGMTSIGDATDRPFEFLLDFAVAMLVCVRQELLKNEFAECIKLLQNYPINDVKSVLTMANGIRETRLQMVAIGQVVAGVNDMRHSGNFNGDWSDTSSISSATSTTSTKMHRRLRESTDLARSSFDSFRRESKESMDDIFRRGVAASGEHWKRASTGDMKRSISQRFDFVKSNVLNKARRSGSVRSTYSESSPSFISSATSTLQQQKHWLLVNQFNIHRGEVMSRSSSLSSPSGKEQHHHLRSNSVNTNYSSEPTPHNDYHQGVLSISSHSNNMLNRFSQMIVSGQKTSSTNPYRRASSPRAHGSPTLQDGPLSEQFSATNEHEENEELLFAKAAAARDQALYYRTSPTYNGCV